MSQMNPAHKLTTYFSKIHEGKVKLSLCFNWAPRYEGVLGKGRYSSTHSWPRHQTEMSGQLHASAALPPGKEPLVPTGQDAGCAPEPVWTRWRREKFSAPSGTGTPNHPAPSPALYHWVIPGTPLRYIRILSRHVRLVFRGVSPL
jgi:hypothetical protein